MSDYYASNTPISRPAKVSGWKTHNFFNGVSWNGLYGFFYPTNDDDSEDISPPEEPEPS